MTAVTPTGRFDAAEAQARGLVPPGHVWDESTQRPIARAEAMIVAQLERPVELAKNLQMFKRNREILVQFVREYLVEADYDSRGYPIAGKLHDFYKVPGSENKALTKLGAEKVGQLFRFGPGATRLVSSQETKEYVSATVEVVLVDQYRREVGSAVSSCSTAEPGYRSPGARRKYGATFKNQEETSPPDYRAALNDVVARARKRAVVQAVIVASAADEIFVSAEADPKAPVGEDAAPAPTDKPRFPANWKDVGGKLIEEASDEQLKKVADWCRTARKPQAVAPLLEAVTDEQERRRLESSDDDLPF